METEGVIVPHYIQFASDTYSQNGEDGILAQVFSELNIEAGWCCDVGAMDGSTFSNTRALIERGWSGLMLEADDQHRGALGRLQKRFPQRLQAEIVTVETSGPNALGNILRRYNAPQAFALLSVDIDGPDFYLWQSLEGYSPAIVVIEIDSAFGPDPDVVQHQARLRGQFGGASFAAMVRLGRQKGYRPIAHPGNLIFARNWLFSRLGIDWKEWSCPKALYNWEFYDPRTEAYVESLK